MSKTSAFIGGSQLGAVKGEIRFGVLRGCVLLAGAVTLAVCPRDPTGASLLASGWLLILSAALSLMRPLVYPRGFADGVVALASDGEREQRRSNGARRVSAGGLRERGGELRLR